MRSRTHPIATLALSVSATLSAPQAALAVQTFDTPAANTAAVQDIYGFEAQGNVSPSVAAGQLDVVVGNGQLRFGTLQGDAVIEFDARYTGPGGWLGLGISVGNNNLLFCPNYPTGCFRIEGPGGFGNSDIGFTPSSAWNHVRVAVDASEKTIEFRITDGVMPSNTFSHLFSDTDYVAGTTLFGLHAQGGGTASFDNFQITTSVPEPGASTMLLGGLALLAWIRRRHAATAARA